MSRMSVLTLALAGSASIAAGQTVTIFGPTEYYQVSDSPFAGLSNLVVEDFEDGFNTAGVNIIADWTVTFQGTFTDSVDADDGVIDGSGSDGAALYAINGDTNGVRFEFDFFELGGLPTEVGVVVTDAHAVQRFEVYDAFGGLLGSVNYENPFSNATGETEEDRFFGASFAGGISAIHVYSTLTGIELDHLQFTAPSGGGGEIPTPGAAAILGIAGVVTARRRR